MDWDSQSSGCLPIAKPAVTTIFRDIVDAVILQPKCPVASTGPHAMMSRDFRHCRNAWERDAIAYRLSDARSELSGDLGRHRLMQRELKALALQVRASGDSGSRLS